MTIARLEVKMPSHVARTGAYCIINLSYFSLGFQKIKKTSVRKFHAGAKVDFEAVPPEEGSGERARMVRYIFLVSIPHIYSSYFLMWGASEDGQIYISSLCSICFPLCVS